MSGWIGVDLDGTLAEYGEWKGSDYIGAPVPVMVERVREWLAAGTQVKIFTARVWDGNPATRTVIEDWCVEHIGQVLPITNQKDYGMIELWDDRCVHVEPNTGAILG